MKKLIKFFFFLLFNILLLFCKSQPLIENNFFYLNHYNCELERFSDFEVFAYFDKLRICIYSPKVSLLNLKKTSKVSTLFGVQEKKIYSGLDISEMVVFRYLKNISFGLLTNLTGVNHQLKSILEILYENNMPPRVIFEPEHGIFGTDDFLSSEVVRFHKKYNIPIVSLYSKIKKPPLEYFNQIDTIVIDIQNLPVRSYTYVSTLTYILETADILQKEVIILDRPHPYGAWNSAGHFLEEGYESFVGEAPVPFLYGLTPGEYSIFMSVFKFKNLKLKVIRMENFDPKNVSWTLANTWINPSPNIPNLESAIMYAGLVFLEGTNLSIGRGTTKPFIYTGSPWLDNETILNEMRKLNLKGVKFGLIEFYPTFSIYKNQKCKGIQIYPVSLEIDPIQVGYEYLRIIKKFHSNQFEFLKSKNQYLIDKLWGSDSYRIALEHNLEYSEFKKLWISESIFFDSLLNDYKIY